MRDNNKRRAEAFRQLLIAESCESAIHALMDDSGPISRLPRSIKMAIQGDLDSAIRTLESAQEKAEAAAEGLQL